MTAERVYLRPLRGVDVDERYVSWHRDPELMRYFTGTQREFTKGSLIAEIERPDLHVYGIFMVDTHLHIGTVKIGPIDEHHRTSDLVVLIGDHDYHGKGLAAEAIRQGNKIAFERHYVRKLHGGMFAANKASIRAYIAADWEIEARLRDHYLVDNEPMDRVLVACWNPSWALQLNREELFEHWRSPHPVGNWPSDYIRPVWRSKILADWIGKLGIPKDGRILEVGCNVGRNLQYLRSQGYTKLSGIEISGHAIARMRKAYPGLDGFAAIYQGAAEDVLPGISESYDLIFTMAVLEHIHPDSIVGVVDQMARLTGTVLAIEPTHGHSGEYQWPHDLELLFAMAGMNLAAKRDLADTHHDFQDYAAWTFVR